MEILSVIKQFKFAILVKIEKNRKDKSIVKKKTGLLMLPFYQHSSSVSRVRLGEPACSLHSANLPIKMAAGVEVNKKRD